ncbi:hypothetical protein D3C86_1822640 [compost metagenome]
MISHIGAVQRLAARTAVESDEDRESSVKFVINALDVAIPRLKSLGDLGYQLMVQDNE